jgi:hypothetical protein
MAVRQQDPMLEMQRRVRVIMRYASLATIPTAMELNKLAVTNMRKLLGMGSERPGTPPMASRSNLSKALSSGYEHRLTNDGSIANVWWGANYFVNIRGRLVNPAWIEFGHGGPAPAPPHPFVRTTGAYLEQITPSILEKHWMRYRNVAIKRMGNVGGGNSMNLNVTTGLSDVEMNNG